MSDNSLNISYTPLAETPGADKPFWLRMVQVDREDDTAMVGEVADLLDKIFEIEPCTQQPGDQIDKPVAPEESIFNAIILREMAFAACLPDYTGAYEVEVKVYRSHGDVPYGLVALNGEFLHAAYHTQDVELSLLIDNAESVNIQHPVVDGFTYDWEGTVFDEDGACPPPEIERQENLVYFGKKVTGRLLASFKTEYDFATLIIHGENRTPQTGNLVAFYNHQSYDKDVEQPLVDGISAMGCPDRPCPDGLEGKVTCYETLHHYSRCECDGKESGQSEHNYETGPEEGTCPEKTLNQYGFASLLCAYEKEVYFDNDAYDGYVECDDNRPYYLRDEDPDDPAWYASICGQSVPDGMELPKCMTTFGPWPEEAATIERGEDYYHNYFGPNVNVIFKPVYPRNGECGTWEKEYRYVDCDIAWEFEPTIIGKPYGDTTTPGTAPNVMMYFAVRSISEEAVETVASLEVLPPNEMPTTTIEEVNIFDDTEYYGAPSDIDCSDPDVTCYQMELMDYICGGLTVEVATGKCTLSEELDVELGMWRFSETIDYMPTEFSLADAILDPHKHSGYRPIPADYFPKKGMLSSFDHMGGPSSSQVSAGSFGTFVSAFHYQDKIYVVYMSNYTLTYSGMDDWTGEVCREIDWPEPREDCRECCPNIGPFDSVTYAYYQDPVYKIYAQSGDSEPCWMCEFYSWPVMEPIDQPDAVYACEFKLRSDGTEASEQMSVFASNPWGAPGNFIAWIPSPDALVDGIYVRWDFTIGDYAQKNSDNIPVPYCFALEPLIDVYEFSCDPNAEEHILGQYEAPIEVAMDMMSASATVAPVIPLVDDSEYIGPIPRTNMAVGFSLSPTNKTKAAVRKKRAVNGRECPGCGRNTLRPIAPLGGLKRVGCKACYHSEVVQ